ncbi:ImmA/IrrE family metallo-endopeptidase [Mycoplasmatota bacterium]|nr:ImmA/IrrE family metallo-endopeptidase [Mycoplasmatota bacterium]
MSMRIDKTEIEKQALQVRKNIHTYGVKDIFSLVAQRDIHLIRYPFGKDNLLGFSTCFEGKKIIVSNSSEILSREIFTIAHELGHTIYDFENEYTNVKIDVEIKDSSEDISEARAFYFANYFLMPEEELNKFIKYELKKTHQELNVLDIVRMQLEFQVSYAALVVRLYDLDFINSSHKSRLFDKRNEMTSRTLFKKLDADERLLKPTNVIEVPPSYLEYVTSNYDKKYIPYSSLEKAFALIGMDSSIFKKEENDEEILDLDDIFEEFE